jgi:6-phosphogluconate dehydrogenase (decarboxylating)
MCEAEELIRKTMFELDMQRTAGIWNPGKIRTLLAADHENCKKEAA